MAKRKIELTLHHNYLAIEDKDRLIQLPIRCAKLIHDMYEIRNAENEEKDIKHYSDEAHNDAEYDISVMMMNTSFTNELTWFSKIIKPFKKWIK